MALHESLNEKMYNVNTHLHMAVKKAEKAFSKLNIAHPFFLDLDSVASSIEGYPNVRTIVDERSDWSECQLSYYKNGKFALQDLFDQEITAIFILEDKVYISTKEHMYASTDGMHFSQYQLTTTVGGTSFCGNYNLEKHRYTHFQSQISNGYESSMVWLGENNVYMRLSTWNTNTNKEESHIYIIYTLESNGIGVFNLDNENLLIFSETSYIIFGFRHYLRNIHNALNNDIPKSQGDNIISEFPFRENIVEVDRFITQKDTFIIRYKNGKVIGLRVSNSLESTLFDLGGSINGASNLITSNGDQLIFGYTDDIFTVQIVDGRTFETTDALPVYPGWDTTIKIASLRGCFSIKNYIVLLDDERVWICPCQPDVGTDEVFMLGYSIPIPAFIRTYTKVWQVGNYIYLLSSVGSLYCMKLPNYIPTALFASRNTDYVNGFYPYVQKGAILSHGIEGQTWEKCALSLIMDNWKIKEPWDIQTAYTNGNGIILYKDTENDKYHLLYITPYEKVFDLEEIIEDIPSQTDTMRPSDITNLTPSSYVILIGATNCRFYLLIYNKIKKSLYLATGQGSMKTLSWQRYSMDDNLRIFMEAAKYMVGFKGNLTVVMDTNMSAAKYATFTFNPELPIDSSIRIRCYNDTDGMLDSVPNVYVSDNQLVINMPGISIWDESNITVKGATNINSEIITHAIGRSNIEYSTLIRNNDDGMEVYQDISNTELYIVMNVLLPSWRLEPIENSDELKCRVILKSLKKMFPQYANATEIEGNLYRLSNSVIYLDLKYKCGAITYDGIGWEIIEEENLPLGDKVKSVFSIGNANYIYTNKGVFRNGDFGPRMSKAHVLEENDCIHAINGCVEYHYKFSFSPGFVIMDINLKIPDLGKVNLSILFSNGEMVGEEEIQKAIKLTGTDGYSEFLWNEEIDEFIDAVFDGKKIDISIKESLIGKSSILDSNVTIYALS